MDKRRVVYYWWTEQRMMCCICGKQMEAYIGDGDTHPLRETIEHLIPRREGGPNIAKNVRLAHFLCNSTLSKQWEISPARPRVDRSEKVGKRNSAA